MTNFIVEKDIPMPERTAGKGKVSIYPFQEMEVGDSFVFTKEQYNRVATSAYQFAKGQNRKMGVRKLSNNNYRCWRIE